MERVGNIDKGKTPSYDQMIDKTFAEKAIKELGEWKGPVCPTAVFSGCELPKLARVGAAG